MPNKIITLTGYSGVGKSKIASSIASQNGLGLICVSDVMTQQARDEHFRTLQSYVIARGVASAFEHARQVIIPEVMIAAQNRGVIIDGMYDSKFLKALRSDFGKDELIVVGMQAGIADRMRRMHARGTGALMGIAADVAKINAGIREVLRSADIMIDARQSLPLTMQECIGKLTPLLRS